MNLIGSKTIETERLILRSTKETDLKTLWNILCLPEVNRYYLTTNLNYDWEKELPWQIKKLERAKDKDIFQWSIILKDSNECIGQISVQEKTEDKTIRDIGWFINPTYQRKGFTYEAATTILNYMFKEVEINAIETGAAVCNPASWRLMEKLGFIKRTNKTQTIHYTFGGDVEECFYGLTKEEYLKLETK